MLLQLPSVDARTLAAREPGLLTFRTAELRARMDHLIERLKVRCPRLPSSRRLAS